MEFETLVAQLRQLGPRRFAAWNEAAFDAYVAGPLANLGRNIAWRDKSADPATLQNYLQLVYEGVGAGWLRTIENDAPPPTFLAHCLGSLLPYKLAEMPRAARSETLRRVWNLGEGLAREPQWLNQYAITQTTWSTDLQHLEQHLAKILAPVLSPLPAAKWRGKYELQVLNLRQNSESFVPGRLYLASPAVLCLEDRVSEGQTLAVLLRKGGKSEVLGAVGRLPEHHEAFTPPAVATAADAITIQQTRVAAPLLAAPRQALCVASGFVAVCADDSQRLWLVEEK